MKHTERNEPKVHTAYTQYICVFYALCAILNAIAFCMHVLCLLLALFHSSCFFPLVSRSYHFSSNSKNERVCTCDCNDYVGIWPLRKATAQKCIATLLQTIFNAILVSCEFACSMLPFFTFPHASSQLFELVVVFLLLLQARCRRRRRRKRIMGKNINILNAQSQQQCMLHYCKQ